VRVPGQELAGFASWIEQQSPPYQLRVSTDISWLMRTTNCLFSSPTSQAKLHNYNSRDVPETLALAIVSQRLAETR